MEPMTERESELTDADWIILNRIMARLAQLSKENFEPTHILMHPDQLSYRPETLLGLTVTLNAWVELGSVYLTVRA